MTKYYKTNSPAVLAAIELIRTEKEALRRDALVFAKHFGGKPVFSHDGITFAFRGLRFSPEKPRDLWTVPDQQAGNHQYPRSRLKSPINKDLKEPLKELNKDWNARAGDLYDRRVKLDPFYSAIGTAWGNVLVCGMQWFEHDGYAWISTGTSLNDVVTEILGSEYHAAREAMENSHD